MTLNHTGFAHPNPAGLAFRTQVRVYSSDMDDLLATDACTLPTAERPLRLAEFDTLFTEAVTGVERAGNSARLHLSGDDRLADRVRDLADRESACCSFFTFAIETQPQGLTLHITVPPQRMDILSSLADRAQELSA